MYLKNSHESRDLPVPATAITETRCAFDSPDEAWNSSLMTLSSRSRPTNGDSRPVERSAPPRPPITRTARQSCTGSALPLSSRTPASSYTTAASVARFVGSPTRTPPGSATAWMREAVFTRSPATMPSDCAPMVTAASPVSTPTRARRPSVPTSAPSASTAAARSIAARTARSASSSIATGAPHTAITASPMNFSTVPP